MTYVITFNDYRPSPRADSIKWTNAHAQEAPDVDGNPGTPITTIATWLISDYPDPTDPPTLDFTTDQATLKPGWYRLRFTDPGAGEEFTAWRYFGFDYRPSTRQVALHILNRTVNSDNVFLGDFTNDTAVTKEDVEGLITKAESFVLLKLDRDPNVQIATEDGQAISDTIALLAAMLVELTKFSEQIQTNRSPYPHLLELYKEQMPALVESIVGTTPGAGGSLSLWDLVASGDGNASYSFPDVQLTSWDERW